MKVEPQRPAVEVVVAVEQVSLDEHAAARAERRAHADADRRAGAVGARGVDAEPGQTSCSSGTMLAVGNPSVRPRWSPCTTSPRSWNGAPRKRAAVLDLAGEHQRADVARGDDLAVDLDQRHDPGLEARVGGQHVGSPAAPWPKRKFSPDRDVRRLQRADEHLVDELLRRLRANRSSNGITTSSETPSAATSSTLTSRLVSSLGAARVDHRQRMGLEGEHRVVAGDHLAVAEVDAVELAHGHPPRARLHVCEHRDLHRGESIEGPATAHRAQTHGRRRRDRLSRAGRRPPQRLDRPVGRGEPHQPVGVEEPDRRRPSAGGSAPAARAAPAPARARPGGPGRRPASPPAGTPAPRQRDRAVGTRRRRRRRARSACGAAARNRRRRVRRSACAHRCPTSTRSRTRGGPRPAELLEAVHVHLALGSSTASPARASS